MKSITLLLALLCAPLAAQDLVFVEHPAGTYALLSTPDGPLLVPFSEVPLIKMGDEGGFDPNPPEPTAFTREVETAARAVDDAVGSQKYSIILMMCSEGLKGGQLETGEVGPCSKHAAQQMLSEAWKTFRDKMGDWAAARAQEGRMDTVKHWRDFLADVREGLRLSFSGSPAMTPDEQRSVMNEVNKIIQAKAWQ